MEERQQGAGECGVGRAYSLLLGLAASGCPGERVQFSELLKLKTQAEWEERTEHGVPAGMKASPHVACVQFNSSPGMLITPDECGDEVEHCVCQQAQCIAFRISRLNRGINFYYTIQSR